MYPVCFGICPGCLLRCLLLRLYLDCGALGSVRWWIGFHFHRLVGLLVDPVFSLGWSLWGPFAWGGGLLWSSVSPMVSVCGREVPLCTVLECRALLCGLRPLCKFAAGTLVPSRFVDSAAVVSFGYLGFFLWSLLDLCVELSPMHLCWDTCYPLLLSWH